MESHGYYGGRRGASFILSKNFLTIDDMIEAFKQANSYTDVKYEEYVLIDTKDKNHRDNGKIYRRGYDFNNELGGAEYIGSIVGPAGPAPMLELDTFENVKKKIDEAETGQYKYVGGEVEYTATNKDIIPGKDKDGNFNDSIKAAYCAIRDDNGEETIAYIGFVTPYFVLDLAAEQISAYSNFSFNRIDDKTHPFYSSYKISIPDRKKNDIANNLRVIIADNTVQPYTGQQDDIEKKRKIIVYDYIDYSKKAAGEKKTYYIGDYNMLTDFSIADDGTITVTYSHEDVYKLNKKIKWLDDFKMDTDYKLKAKWNTDSSYTNISNTIKWLDDFKLDTTDYKFKAKWNTNNSYTNISDTVKWLTDFKLDTTDYRLKTKWNNKNSYDTISEPIKWISNISVNTTGNQKLHVTYNTGLQEDIGDALNSILKMAIDNDYLIVLYSDPAKRGTYSYDGRNDWYILGKVNSETKNTAVIIGAAEDSKTIEEAKKLPVGGIWMVLS